MQLALNARHQRASPSLPPSLRLLPFRERRGNDDDIKTPRGLRGELTPSALSAFRFSESVDATMEAPWWRAATRRTAFDAVANYQWRPLIRVFRERRRGAACVQVFYVNCRLATYKRRSGAR